MARKESGVGDLDGRSWWEKPRKRTERLERVLACLREDARMPLTEISRRTGIPTSTVFDAARAIEGRFWFTAVFLDEKACRARERVVADPTAPHRWLTEVIE